MSYRGLKSQYANLMTHFTKRPPVLSGRGHFFAVQFMLFLVILTFIKRPAYFFAELYLVHINENDQVHTLFKKIYFKIILSMKAMQTVSLHIHYIRS